MVRSGPHAANNLINAAQFRQRRRVPRSSLVHTTNLGMRRFQVMKSSHAEDDMALPTHLWEVKACSSACTYDVVHGQA